MNRKVIVGVIMAFIFIMSGFAIAVDGNISLFRNQKVNSMENVDIYHYNGHIYSINPHNNGESLRNYYTPVISYRHYISRDHHTLHLNIILRTGNFTNTNKSPYFEQGTYGSVYVKPVGNLFYLNMTITERSKDTTSGINTIPGDCSNAYYDFTNNHEAVLVVTKFATLSPSDFTPAEIIAVIGEVVANGVSVVEADSPAAIIAAPEIGIAIATVLAADYIAMDTYAVLHNDPSLYFDAGISWGTQWYNFYSIGYYLEEGVFTGNANSYSSGMFIPIAIAGGRDYSPTSPNFFSVYDPHSSVWNPNDEPPW